MNDSEYSRYNVLAEIAEMYYHKEMQQAEIAGRMKISRSLVSKMLAEAQEKGVVSISINHFFKRSEHHEKELCRRYGLKGAGVLILPNSMKNDEVKQQLGRFSANLIYDEMTRGQNIGFTFGTTLKETVCSLSLKQPRPVTFIQLTGSLGAAEAAFDSHELVHMLSAAWNSEGIFLHAPMIVNSLEIKNHLYSSRSNIRNAELCKKLDTAVVGLSSYEDAENAALYYGGHIGAEDLHLMRDSGIIGDVGSYSIDSEGRLIEIKTLTRMIGLDESGWKNVKNRYGIASGEKKINIIKAALSGGWLTDFITDEQTASNLL